ncbi:unnamed protein product [Didymodactylos carnosus]|uniref:Dienelactone hydrolase domain-containing protein n=1 Tax=Didymodactylos carnosus TaxID=1234261 RepID=A0A813U7B4_9BILA|nr:unnamed protein product [Didymodactylos carnosus]CAF0819382.1 unnamed protein product [Didymodactylos carnosus]CAF3510926.1 unnamed protein product [Didymodactylos carnosus]CAF3605727.1 unnamed protein product [Didymodactylos carnosus]
MIVFFFISYWTTMCSCVGGKPKVIEPTQYVCKGKVNKIQGLDVYNVGDEEAALVVIVLCDVFGINIPQTRIFCDRLVKETDVRVFMPDIFRGKPYPVEKFPPSDPNEILEHIEKVGSWAIVENDLKMLNTEVRKADEEIRLAIIGFSWAGSVALKACGHFNDYICGISIHGSMLNMHVQDADKVQCPMLFLLASDDSPVDEIKNVLGKKPFGNKCLYKTYPNMKHGFVAARADMANEENLQAINDVHKQCKSFLQQF